MREQDGLGIKHLQNVFDVDLGIMIQIRLRDDTDISFAPSEGHQHTNTNLHLSRQRCWYGIGEETVERQRQDDVDEQSLLEEISGGNLPGLGLAVVLMENGIRTNLPRSISRRANSNIIGKTYLEMV